MCRFEIGKENKAFVNSVYGELNKHVFNKVQDAESMLDDVRYYCRNIEQDSFQLPEVLAHDLGKLLFWLLMTIQTMDAETRKEVLAEFYETLKEQGEYAETIKEIPDVE